MNNYYKTALIGSAMMLALPCWATCFSANQAAITKPDKIYAVHGDGTVTDLQTGLMWSQCEVGKSGTDCETGTATGFTSWEDALQYALDSELAGYNDWRMPNIKELNSLTESSCTNPAINSGIFKAASSSYLWSASVRQDTAGYYVWVVNGDTGHVQAAYKNPSNGIHLRLVRSSP